MDGASILMPLVLELESSDSHTYWGVGAGRRHCCRLFDHVTPLGKLFFKSTCRE